MKRYPVISIQIHATNIAAMLEELAACITAGRRVAVHVCTAHTTLEAYANAALTEAINTAAYAVPDGMPLVWLGRLRGHEVSRCYGPDLMLALCRDGVGKGYRHYLYGGSPEALSRLEPNLETLCPGITIVGRESPPFRVLSPDEEQHAIRRINDAKPDMVWVGLGTPKQDLWLARFREQLDAPVIIAVGAAFDFHSGAIRQAPRWMMRAGLEWLFRLCVEPRRLWKRYVLGNAHFILLCLRQALRKGVALQPRKRSQP
jgi:N-acetylglucosaminyldiphosphoundecaprenol N-acetyl-beta-D-mannosaminyltransferase